MLFSIYNEIQNYHLACYVVYSINIGFHYIVTLQIWALFSLEMENKCNLSYIIIAKHVCHKTEKAENYRP